MHVVAPMGRREWALLFALSLLWGFSFVLAGLALRELAPLTVAFLRIALAALALMAVAMVRGITVARNARDWRDYAVMGLLNNAVPFSLFAWALPATGAGLAAILNATTPFFTIILAQVLTPDEKLTPGKLVGVALGVAGVAVLMGWQALAGLTEALLPSLACLGAAVSYALSSIWGRRFRGRPIAAPATGQLTCASIILLPLVVFFETPWRQGVPGAVTVAAVLALALVSTALAYFIYFRILRTSGATNLGMVTLLIPPTAVILGWLVLGEALPLQALPGMALIGLGIAAIDGRPWLWLRRRGRVPV